MMPGTDALTTCCSRRFAQWRADQYPDPISPKVYWRREEDWVELPYTYKAPSGEGEQPRIELSPPVDFIKLLRDLGADLGNG